MQPTVRKRYVDEVIALRKRDVVKIVTGMHGCGKSTVLKAVKDIYQQESTNPNDVFIFMSMFDRESRPAGSRELFEIIEAQASQFGRTYIFLCDIQLIMDWSDAVIAIKQSFDCDIYLTCSNAFSFSDPNHAIMFGQFAEIRMYPLSLSERIETCGVETTEGMAAFGPDGSIPLVDMFSAYYKYGGTPKLARLDITEKDHRAYFERLVRKAIISELIGNENITGAHKIGKPILLQDIASYLAKSIGKPIGSSNMSKDLAENGVSISDKTIKAYIAALENTYCFTKVNRFDIKNRVELKTRPKYYAGDLGFATFLRGYSSVVDLPLLENAIFLELQSDGYAVSIGKYYDKEITFVAAKGGNVTYIQVCIDIQQPETRTRILAPLKSIPDSYPKVVVALRGFYPSNINGIKIVMARDFFLHKS